MVQVSPFAAWRYDLSQVGDLSSVIAPAVLPISGELQDELYQRHPCNAIRLVRNRDEPGDLSADDRHARADDFFRLWKQEAILFHEHDAAFYVCEQAYHTDHRQHSAMSVYGRMQLTEDDCASITLLSAPDPEAVRDAYELLNRSAAQFQPIHALVLDDSADQDTGLLFDELRTAVARLTPLQVVDDDGVIHRIWPVTDRGTIDRIQELVQPWNVILTSGTEHYLAARQRFLESRSPDLSHSLRTPGDSVLTCLTSWRDPGLVSLPTAFLFSTTVDWSPAELTSRLQAFCHVESSGCDSAAADDACQLASLSDRQPAIALGRRDGLWFVLSAAQPLVPSPPAQRERARVSGGEDSPVTPDTGTGIPEEIIAIRLFADRIRAALTADGDTGALPPKRCRLPLTDQGILLHQQMGLAQCDTAILVPGVAVSRIADAAAGSDCFPADEIRLMPAPLAGLVYDSH